MSRIKAAGDRGEAEVAKYLRKKGYTLLASGYTGPMGEIDLIARSPEGILCFVEVKTRKDDAFAAARDLVTPTQKPIHEMTLEEFERVMNI